MQKLLEQIKRLHPFELLCLLKNIRLGEGHLKKHLNATQFKQLLAISRLYNGDEHAIKTDPIEKSSNVTMIINTIITGVLGGSLGFVAFMELEFKSKVIFISILVIVVILSAYFGYYSFKLTKKTTYAALTHLKLQKVQLEILKILRKKLEVEEKKLMEEINHHLSTTNTPIHEHVQLEQAFASWMKLTKEKIKNSKNLFAQNEKMLLKEIEKIEEKINTLFKENILDKETVHHKNDKKSFMKLLVDSTLSSTKIEVKKTSWVKTHFFQILIDGVPTVLGCGASMFVYLTGVPGAVRTIGFGIPWIPGWVLKPTAFVIAILATFYLGYAFVHKNYKAFKRDQELEKITEKITHEEDEINKLNEKAKFLQNVNELLQNIISTISTFERIVSNL